MGCGNSKEAAPAGQELAPTSGGGSMIMPGSGSRAPVSTSSSIPDPSLVVTKGGSYVLGRKDAGSWEPGRVVTHAPNTDAPRVAYLPAGQHGVLRVSYAAISEQGRSPRPPQKPNQDAWCALPGLGNDPSVALFGVFDGHGPRGEDASAYACVNVPDITLRQAVFARDPFTALERSFEIAHKQFISPVTAQAGVDTTVSGTTAIVVMFRGNHWVCANVGDSRAIMGYVGQSGEVAARALSVDHKPTRPDERARVNASRAAKILSERALGIEGGDPDKYYICRVHNGTIRYGVLFTRSIGDADAHSYLGLSAEPEVKKGVLDAARDKFFVIASDGVWDYVSDEQVASIVARTPDDAQAAVEAVTSTARRRWDAESEHRRDDITAIVVLVKLMSVAEAEAEQQAAKAAAAAAATVDVDVMVDDGKDSAGAEASQVSPSNGVDTAADDGVPVDGAAAAPQDTLPEAPAL